MNIFSIILVFAATAVSEAVVIPPPEPPIAFRPSRILADEKPVIIETQKEIVADNGLFQSVKTTITFTNPNRRAFEGELEFPLPPGATVCGYELEINGAMVPGVVCEKEAARTAFENEKRKGVDPGLVEQVKGNVWKTRIYPLMPGKPRKASVSYIHELTATDGAASQPVVETDGENVFVGVRRGANERTATRADRLRQADKARIYWDASMSRHGKVAADRNLLECLPESGDWELVVFRNVIEKPLRFTSRADLLKAIDALVYDGATCLEAVDREARNLPNVFVFTDERDEDAAMKLTVKITKLNAGDKPPSEPKPGKLLATAWAAQRVAELSVAAESNKRELIELGRRYGIASPVTSLIVLESLDQYLRYKIEPPKSMSFHAEWVRRRAAEDDPIAAEKAKTEHHSVLLKLWEERVKWWKDPIPPKNTPKSGLFARAIQAVTGMHASEADVIECREVSEPPPCALREADSAAANKATRSTQRQDTKATVKIAAWNPQTPYLKAIDTTDKKLAYAEYLKQREVYGQSPAFYLDCAGWFFKAKERLLAERIISNLEEMKLEDAGLWRTMGWRLREADSFDEAVATFRHVLAMRGEEPQSRRDLALVLTERGKSRYAAGDVAGASADLTEAMRLLHEAAFVPTARRSGRRSNDMQTSVIALEELNGLITWIGAHKWKKVKKPSAPKMDSAFRREMPLKLRIMLSWDTDETDVDLHVLEPDGEEAFYRHRRTSSGGFVSEDVTTGYGPEEYLRKEAQPGVYKILANYYASHRQALTGAATVTATVYTDWGRKNEQRQILSFRLDKPKAKHPIGEITVE